MFRNEREKRTTVESIAGCEVKCIYKSVEMSLAQSYVKLNLCVIWSCLVVVRSTHAPRGQRKWTGRPSLNIKSI